MSVARALGLVAVVAVFGCAHSRFALRPTETEAVVHLRAFLSYEAAYSFHNKGFFDSPACLPNPAQCLPDYPPDGPSLLSAEMAAPVPGYRKVFHPGPHPTELTGGVSRSSIQSYSFTLEPVEAGRRWFCGDSTGRLCYSPTALVGAEGGQCPSSCRDLP